MEDTTLIDSSERWIDIDKLLTRNGNLVGPGFEPCPELREFLQQDCKVLCIGAGGLGCEILKDLALSGFVNIDVIDMDIIDVSNLNRQFLFRIDDVGKPKAVVAAERINARVPGANVTAHFGRIEDMPLEFYQEFTVIILGLDSLEARRYMNSIACSLLEFDEEGNTDTSSIKPLVDGGTEGFKGHARVILPGVTPCFECTLWLFPPQTKFPLCTLAETPRTPAHCIEYAHLILWSQQRSNEEFDTDNEEHMQWVYNNALTRAKQYGIEGVSFQLTQGVVKNIIPAIASTNAIVSAACVLEALKLITMCSTGLNNYMMYTGSQGIYTHTVAYERDPQCPVCSAGVELAAPADSTLQQVIDLMLKHPQLGKMLAHPSVSYGAKQLYARGIYEEDTRPNLGRPVRELLEGDESAALLTVNDKKLSAPLRVRLRLKEDQQSGVLPDVVTADINRMTRFVESMASHFGKELTLCYITKQPKILNLDFDTVLNRCSSMRELLGIRDSDIPLMLRKCPQLLLVDSQQLKAAYDHIPRVVSFTPALVRQMVTKYPPVLTMSPQRLAGSVERLRQLCYTREEWARDFESISPSLLAYFLRDATDQLMRLEYLASTGERPEWQLHEVMKPAGRSFRSKLRNYWQWEMRVKQRRAQAKAAAAVQQQQAEAAAIKAELLLLAVDDAGGGAGEQQQQQPAQQ